MTNRFNFSLRIVLLLMGVVLLAETQAAYNIVDRFQLLEDKFRTHEMMRPYDNDDFILDISALLNTDATDFIDGAQEVADFQGDETQKLAKAQEFLTKYDKTEQNLRVNVGLQIPLFDFTVAGVKFKPAIRAQGNLGFLMGIQTENLSTADILEFIGDGVPSVIADKLLNCTTGLTANQDLVVWLRTEPACGLTAQESAAIADQEGKYFYPDPTAPDIYNYLKGEARAGLYFDYIYDEHFFGQFNIYALGRADYKVRISKKALTSDGDVIDLPDEMNTTVNMAVDYSLGYKNGNLMAIAGIEDLKLTTMSDNEEEGGKLIYGSDPLFRLHSEYLYKFSAFSVKPFVGLHKRASYGFDDGYYLGADLGAHVWGDRIGLRVRGMIDGEHFTFSPMAKLWLIHVEYMLKQPLSSDVNGLKPATIHSLNFRISI